MQIKGSRFQSAPTGHCDIRPRAAKPVCNVTRAACTAVAHKMDQTESGVETQNFATAGGRRVHGAVDGGIECSIGSCFQEGFAYFFQRRIAQPEGPKLPVSPVIDLRCHSCLTLKSVLPLMFDCLLHPCRTVGFADRAHVGRHRLERRGFLSRNRGIGQTCRAIIDCATGAHWCSWLFFSGEIRTRTSRAGTGCCCPWRCARNHRSSSPRR